MAQEIIAPRRYLVLVLVAFVHFVTILICLRLQYSRLDNPVISPLTLLDLRVKQPPKSGGPVSQHAEISTERRTNSKKVNPVAVDQASTNQAAASSPSSPARQAP